jgi:hypothetical protein
MTGGDDGGEVAKGLYTVGQIQGGNPGSGGGTYHPIKTFRKVNNLGGSGSSRKSGGGSGSGGGGGSKSAKIKRSKKSSIVKRYKAVTDDLQDVTRAQEKASKAAERLY